MTVYYKSMAELSWEKLLDALPVIKTMEHFHNYLYRRKLVIATDWASQKWLFGFETRWALPSNHTLE